MKAYNIEETGKTHGDKLNAEIGSLAQGKFFKTQKVL